MVSTRGFQRVGTGLERFSAADKYTSANVFIPRMKAAAVHTQRFAQPLHWVVTAMRFNTRWVLLTVLRVPYQTHPE